MDSSTKIQNRNGPRNKLKFLAIHLGASECVKINEKVEEYVERICENVMQQSFDQNQNLYNAASDVKPTAELAAVQLVKLLEDHPSLNAGNGSNLTMEGRVECDASLMSDRSGYWTGIGSVSGCRNPILLVYSLYLQQSVPRPLSLVQPNLLVGRGARQWMKEFCPELSVVESKLITKKSLVLYQKIKSRFDSKNKSISKQSALNHDESDSSFQSEPCPRIANQSLDTVGALVIDDEENFAAAVSSGGILLKRTGRIGQAALPGAGCWSENKIAIVTTGVGEFLSNKLLARAGHELINKTIHDYNKSNDGDLSRDTVETLFRTNFSTFEARLGLTEHSHQKRHSLFGFLALYESSTSQPDGKHIKQYHLSCVHNVKSMIVGYMSENDDHLHLNYTTNEDMSSLKISTMEIN